MYHLKTICSTLTSGQKYRNTNMQDRKRQTPFSLSSCCLCTSQLPAGRCIIIWKEFAQHWQVHKPSEPICWFERECFEVFARTHIIVYLLFSIDCKYIWTAEKKSQRLFCQQYIFTALHNCKPQHQTPVTGSAHCQNETRAQCWRWNEKTEKVRKKIEPGILGGFLKTLTDWPIRNILRKC